MIYLSWRRGDPHMVAFHRTIAVSNRFYEIHTQCPADHVVQTTNADGSDGVPYKPTWFPVGICSIPKPKSLDAWKRTSRFTAPYFIPTDAHQLVDEWELDEHLLYKYPTGRQVMDWGYGIHHSQILYTFGCLRVLDIPDQIWLAHSCWEALDGGEHVEMEVA